MSSANNDESKQTESPSGILNYFMHLGQAKRTYRSGWILRGVKEPESIADHMYRMSMIAFVLAPSGTLDRSKCIEMCLIHDLAECIVGDLTPKDNVSKEEKTNLENAAIEKLREFLNTTDSVSMHLASLYREYVAHETAEARYVKSLDLFDMFLQAYEYEKLQENLDLQEFFSQIKSHPFEPQIKEWIDELMEIRDKKLNVLPKNSNLNTILKFYI